MFLVIGPLYESNVKDMYIHGHNINVSVKSLGV